MLQSQVNYWNLQETKRHNQVTEELEKQKTEYQGMTANASMMQAETGRMLVPAEFTKANASMMQAEAAKENVQVNWQNAYTNMRNAATNERNAAVNEQNAMINYMNALTNQGNLEVNAYNAATQRLKADSEVSLNTSNELLNYQKKQTEYWETQTAQAKTSTAKTDAAYEPIVKNFDILNAATSSIKDVASSFNSIITPYSGKGGVMGAVLNLIPLISAL